MLCFWCCWFGMDPAGDDKFFASCYFAADVGGVVVDPVVLKEVVEVEAASALRGDCDVLVGEVGGTTREVVAAVEVYDECCDAVTGGEVGEFGNRVNVELVLLALGVSRDLEIFEVVKRLPAD